MSIEIPDKWLGKPVEGALERALKSGKTKKVPATCSVSEKCQKSLRPNQTSSILAFPERLFRVPPFMPKW